MVATARLRFPKSRLRMATTKRPKHAKTGALAPSRKSWFITFEGGDGAGKSTLIARLEKELIVRGFQVVVTREPGGSDLGEKIRELLLNHKAEMSVSDKAELLLFLAARAQHIEEVILPALKAGKVVLCDRFNDSTIAYQGSARGMGIDYVENLCQIVCNGVIPDLTLFLDLEPHIGLMRAARAPKKGSTSATDRFESQKLQFHENVRQAFLALAKRFPERFHVIDATQTADEVFSEAIAALSERLNL